MGGNYPFQITSGHNRWSIHSLNNANQLMLDTHRGTPHLVMNTRDAERIGIADNDMVRVYNDMGEFQVPVATSPSARARAGHHVQRLRPLPVPELGHGPNDVEPGMIKWLHLAGGYGHLRYWSTEWQPCARHARHPRRSSRSWGKPSEQDIPAAGRYSAPPLSFQAESASL